MPPMDSLEKVVKNPISCLLKARLSFTMQGSCCVRKIAINP